MSDSLQHTVHLLLLTVSEHDREEVTSILSQSNTGHDSRLPPAAKLHHFDIVPQRFTATSERQWQSIDLVNPRERKDNA